MTLVSVKGDGFLKNEPTFIFYFHYSQIFDIKTDTFERLRTSYKV